METFTNDIYSIYTLINNNDESKTFMHIKTISKQYLAYYVYRIITKYLNIVEMGSSSSDINEFMSYLRIPKEHNRLLNYPLAGKLTNDDKILDMIILRGIDILKNTDKYIKSMPTDTSSYDDLYDFFKQKELTVIIQDLIDLQTLIPGLSVPEIRPNYLDNSNLL
jgi:hypothetical protein